jgi:hypothetical protein
VKVIAAHHCGRHHRTFTALANCMLPRACWIVGDGPFAVIAWCGSTSVRLYSDLEAAVRARSSIDASGCGGRCVGHHEVVRLDLGLTR